MFLPIALLIGCAGCANRAAIAPIPGSANAFDSASYVSLMTAKGIIDQTKTDLTANVFPASQVATIKTALNGAIQAFDIAQPVYLAYHAAAIAGAASNAQQTATQNALANVNTSISTLATAKVASK